MANGDNSTFKFFHYDPSLAAAVLFTVLFAGSTFAHGYQMIRHRSWLMIPLFVGGCCTFFHCSHLALLTELVEWIGYIGRAISCQQTPDWTLGPYIVSTILVLVAPALFAASIYMLLGRIICVTRAEKLSIIRPSRLTKIFVGGDVLSFLMQASGKFSSNPWIEIADQSRWQHDVQQNRLFHFNRTKHNHRRSRPANTVLRFLCSDGYRPPVAHG